MASAVYDLAMDELSPLFQEIEFHERYRGYDPDEVDAFVDRVARAAAVMRGRISELHERVEAAEARGGAVGGHSDTEETLTRTLVLAQRTADAAIAEAREEADRLTADAATSAQAILSAAEAEARSTLREAHAEAAATVGDATDRAGRILAEAETDRRTMVAEAEALASHAAAAERERLAAEVSELHEYRAFLADDIEILERHLAEERGHLTASLAALTDLLDSPEVFRSTRPPATSGVEIDAAQLAAIAEPDDALEIDEVVEPDDVVVIDEVVETDDEREPMEVTSPVDDFDAVAPPFEPAEEPAEESVPEPAGEPVTIDLVAAEAEAAVVDEPVATEFPLDRSDPDPEGPGSTATEPDPPGRAAPAFAGMSEHALGDTPAPRRLVTAADLEATAVAGGRAGYESSTLDRFADDGGPVTEAMPVLPEGSLFAEPDTADDPFLAQLRDAVGVEPMPDESDDEALSAFFDQEDDESSRSWFGRRR